MMALQWVRLHIVKWLGNDMCTLLLNLFSTTTLYKEEKVFVTLTGTHIGLEKTFDDLKLLRTTTLF
jgi:hypothetical protein